jgi:Chaperone of endosialidase
MATDDAAATEKIAHPRGVTWDRREDASEDAKEQPGIGVIAQESENVFPELVTTDEQGRKKVE